jgi:hypothetical protein
MLEDDIKDWIENFVSKFNPGLGHIPCPFAKAAVIKDQIKYVTVNSIEDIINLGNNIANNGLPKPIIVVGCNPDILTPLELEDATKQINGIMKPSGIVGLDDHPESSETINGVSMNQGKWALILIQEANELVKARKILESKGYYDKWTQEQKDDMFSRK